MIDLGLIMGGFGGGLAVIGWLVNVLFGRLTNTLDTTAQRLQSVAELTAGHSARLDALERLL